MNGTKKKFDTKKVTLNQQVLVVGCGIAGIHTAKEIKSLGYTTTLIEKSDTIGGLAALFDGNGVKLEQMLSGVELYLQSTLTDVSGNIGAFSARVQTPGGWKTVDCGAIVLATGAETGDKNEIFSHEKILPIAKLAALVPEYAGKNKRMSVGLVLDMHIEETKASTEMALKLAIQMQREYNCEVFIFLREVRVASLALETLYDEAREALVNIIKYEGAVTLQPSPDGILIKARDVILGDTVMVGCEIAGISSYGLCSMADLQLAEIAGVDCDALGQMQNNNVHLFPGLTNRPGIFVAGACRGRYYIPQIITEVKAAALAVHSLLSQKYLEIELSNAVVDEDKCALCLTCIRSCPHKAMTINRDKTAAESIPEACQKCGICAGECPAKAIQLPMYTDEELQKQVH